MEKEDDHEDVDSSSSSGEKLNCMTLSKEQMRIAGAQFIFAYVIGAAFERTGRHVQARSGPHPDTCQRDDAALGVDVVDPEAPIGLDESSGSQSSSSALRIRRSRPESSGC
jgi:hypothetical protein